jgi:RimJ/RimL family protein N-acetyltransferase
MQAVLLQQKKMNSLNAIILIGCQRRFFSYINNSKDYNLKDENTILKTKSHNLNIIPLTQKDSNHFDLYMRIITRVGVFNTSSWIRGAFGNRILTINDQANADAFFGSQMKAMFKQYEMLTKYNDPCQAGYYAITQKGTVVGGAGLVPVDINAKGRINSCDLALHISPEFQKSGYGRDLTHSLLQFGFDRNGLNLDSVVGTSLKTNHGTSTLCSQFGMVIRSKDDLKYYYINADMWKALLGGGNKEDGQQRTVLSDIFANGNDEVEPRIDKESSSSKYQYQSKNEEKRIIPEIV